MTEVIALASRRPQEFKNITSFNSLLDIVKLIAPEKELTESAKEIVIIDDNKLPLYDLDNPIGELSDLDKGALNYMANLDNKLSSVLEEIMGSIEPFKLAAIEGVLLQINRKQYKTASDGLMYTGFMVDDKVNNLLVNARNLLLQLRFVEIFLHTNVGERCGFTKYAIYENKIVPAFKSYSLLSTDSY